MVSSSNYCLAGLPEALRVSTLFGIAHGKVITATLTLVLSIDSTIRFAPSFILEKNVREGGIRTTLSGDAGQMRVRLTIGR